MVIVPINSLIGDQRQREGSFHWRACFVSGSVFCMRCHLFRHKETLPDVNRMTNYLKKRLMQRERAFSLFPRERIYCLSWSFISISILDKRLFEQVISEFNSIVEISKGNLDNCLKYFKCRQSLSCRTKNIFAQFFRNNFKNGLYYFNTKK